MTDENYKRRVRELRELEDVHARKAAEHYVNPASEYEEQRLEHALGDAVQAGYELGATHAREMAKEAAAAAATTPAGK